MSGATPHRMPWQRTGGLVRRTEWRFAKLDDPCDIRVRNERHAEEDAEWYAWELHDRLMDRGL